MNLPFNQSSETNVLTHRKYYSNSFLKFHHQYRISTAFAQKLKKRRRAMLGKIRLKYYKKVKKKSSIKKFKQRIRLKKLPSFTKALFFFAKKKSILFNLTLKSHHKLTSYGELENKTRFKRLHLHKKITSQNRRISLQKKSLRYKSIQKKNF